MCCTWDLMMHMPAKEKILEQTSTPKGKKYEQWIMKMAVTKLLNYKDLELLGMPKAKAPKEHQKESD